MYMYEIVKYTAVHVVLDCMDLHGVRTTVYI